MGEARKVLIPDLEGQEEIRIHKNERDQEGNLKIPYLSKTKMGSKVKIEMKFFILD